ITIRWAPGHRDIGGNERADVEAKRAAQEGSSSAASLPRAYRDVVLPQSRSARKQLYNANLKQRVVTAWRKSPRYHRIKRFDPSFPSDKYLLLSARMPHA
ncbi:hypothetical protein C8R44DRAFT_554371, partial [Mycena epipterygia]